MIESPTSHRVAPPLVVHAVAMANKIVHVVSSFNHASVEEFNLKVTISFPPPLGVRNLVSKKLVTKGQNQRARFYSFNLLA